MAKIFEQDVFFDDFRRKYTINGKEFFVDTLGNTWMDGLALVTKNTNRELFNRITNEMIQKFHLVTRE